MFSFNSLPPAFGREALRINGKSFTCKMSFLSQNQHCQRTEGNSYVLKVTRHSQMPASSFFEPPLDHYGKGLLPLTWFQDSPIPAPNIITTNKKYQLHSIIIYSQYNAIYISTLLWILKWTRSTETVHTSTKAHLTIVTKRIRICIHDPDCHQNLIIVNWPIANLPWRVSE